MEIQNIARDKIFPDKEQPRKYFDEEVIDRLKKSIKDKGIKVPLKVRPEGNNYIIVDGEMRYKASKSILNELPCIIEVYEHELQAFEDQLISDFLHTTKNSEERDNSIYKFYEHWNPETKTVQKEKYVRSTSDKNFNNVYKNSTMEIARRLGISDRQVLNVIDRYELKEEFPELKEESKKDEKSDGFNFTNSTIAQTKSIENKEIRKEATKQLIELKRQNKIINEDVIKATKEINSTENITKQETKNIINKIVKEREREREIENKEKKKKKERKEMDSGVIDANKTLAEYNKYLNYMFFGLGDLLKLWDKLDEDLKVEYIKNVKHFIKTNKEFIENNKTNGGQNERISFNG